MGISTLENILIHETKQAIIQSLYKFEVVWSHVQARIVVIKFLDECRVNAKTKINK